MRHKAMPVQKIETLDEAPGAKLSPPAGLPLGSFPLTMQEDFRNRLIWGDNKLVMASLLKEFLGRTCITGQNLCR